MLKPEYHKQAMSLGEVLITLAIVGIVAAITTPVLITVIPDKSDTLIKRGTYTIEHTVSDIVNNETYYPVKKVVTKEGTGDDETQIVSKVYGLRNTDKITENGVEYSGDTKFCMLFASKFQLYPNTSVTCTTTAADKDEDGYTFKSSDGIEWKVPVSAFSSDNALEIVFKTSDKPSQNCFHNEDGCDKPGKVLYHLTPEGRLYKDEVTSDTVRTNAKHKQKI